MFRPLSKKKAQSTIEYVSFLIILMFTLMFFGKYIYQALAGRWRDAGETFGFGMQYEPGNTIECKFDTFSNTGCWYDKTCFEINCDCHTVAATTATCYDCIIACERCNDAGCPPPP